VHPRNIIDDKVSSTLGVLVALTGALPALIDVIHRVQDTHPQTVIQLVVAVAGSVYLLLTKREK